VDAPHLEKIVVSFGYTKPDTVVHNYWDERPAVRVDSDQVKWILMARPQEKALLLVLQSWATNDLTVKLTWDTQVLGFTPGTRTLNAENGAQLPVTDGAISVDIPGPYGVRLLKTP
jgi:hypothetical protein